MRRFCLLTICIIYILTYPAHIMAVAKQTEQTLSRQEDSKRYKEQVSRMLLKISDGEKTNEIFVNFMKEDTDKTEAEALLKKMLPDFNCRIIEQVGINGPYLVSFETSEMALNAILILNEFDSIFFASMNSNNIYATRGDKIGSGTPIPKAPDGFRIKVGSNLMTDSSGKQTPLDPDDENIVPFIDSESGRTLVPLRALAIDEYTTIWNEDTQEITLERVSEQIKLKIGSRNVVVITVSDAAETKLENTIVSETEPVIYHDRTYVPLRLICELWGYNVEWIEETQEIILKKTDVNSLISVEPFGNVKKQ